MNMSLYYHIMIPLISEVEIPKNIWVFVIETGERAIIYKYIHEIIPQDTLQIHSNVFDHIVYNLLDIIFTYNTL